MTCATCETNSLVQDSIEAAAIVEELEEIRDAFGDEDFAGVGLKVCRLTYQNKEICSLLLGW